MGRYANPGDCKDPAVRVSEAHILDAETRVDRVLRAKGIDPAEVSLPQPDLTALAICYALEVAALQGSSGEGPLMEKNKAYRQAGKDMAAEITRAALGLSSSGGTAGGGLGSIEIGRG